MWGAGRGMDGRKRKICIIGHFGGDDAILDGQTVKTRILYEELSRATSWRIARVDTYYRRRRPWKLLVDTLVCLFTARDVIVLLSRNGMRFYFPLLSVFARLLHTRVYHDVIGGNLDRLIAEHPRYRRYLNTFAANWVETAGLKARLEALGIGNCEVIPNFKRLNIAQASRREHAEPYRFCTFSRVMREKGVEAAIDAIQAINAAAGRVVCELDIFGWIDEGYREAFEGILRDATPAVRYKGLVPYERSVEAIRDHYALLFPTFWEGEGFPGTIIDAFSAGLPVIATDWNCNGEIIVHGENGILYPKDGMRDLREAIQWLIANPRKVDAMRRSCIQSAQKYRPDSYVRQIVREISEASGRGVR